MTKIDQKKKLDNDMLSHCASLQTSVLMENYDLAEDFAVLLLDRIKQQRLLLAAPKPQARPPVSFQEGQALLYAMGHQDIIESAGCCVIGGGE